MKFDPAKTVKPVWLSKLQLPLKSQQCYPEGTMVPFWFAGERSILSPVKGGPQSSPLPDTLGQRTVLSVKVRLQQHCVPTSSNMTP